VSPTTAHCGSPKLQSTLPRSWTSPVTTNQRGVPVGTDRLGRLQRVLDLAELDVGIAVVDQRLHELERFPRRHAPAVARQVLALLRADEVERLPGMVEPVELVDGRARARAVVPETGRLGGRTHGLTRSSLPRRGFRDGALRGADPRDRLPSSGATARRGCR
jgi:hypothetical protein